MAAIASIVLRGGLSRRMGWPKDQLRFGGETLLERIVRQLSPATSPIVVVSAPGQEPPRLSASVILAHDAVAGKGPLAGLAAGLRAMPGTVELAYATSVDAPFLEPGFVERLATLIGGHDLAIPLVLGRYHPLSAVYRIATALPAVESLLERGESRMSAIVDVISTRVVSEAESREVDPGLRTLRNLNTFEDYKRASEEL